MGCFCSSPEQPMMNTSSAPRVEEIEDKIFQLLRDSFCASGPEAAMFGQALKEEELLKLDNKMKKIEDSRALLERKAAADFFLTKVAQVDPVEGEIVITYERVMQVCSKFDIEELYMLYEKLRGIKVDRLRQDHGSDIVSIIDEVGDAKFSECRRKDRGGGSRREDVEMVNVSPDTNVRNLALV